LPLLYGSALPRISGAANFFCRSRPRASVCPCKRPPRIAEALLRIEARLDAIDQKLAAVSASPRKAMEWIGQLAEQVRSLDSFREEVRASLEPLFHKLESLDDVLRIVHHATSDVARRVGPWKTAASNAWWADKTSSHGARVIFPAHGVLGFVCRARRKGTLAAAQILNPRKGGGFLEKLLRNDRETGLEDLFVRGIEEPGLLAWRPARRQLLHAGCASSLRPSLPALRRRRERPPGCLGVI